MVRGTSRSVAKGLGRGVVVTLSASLLALACGGRVVEPSSQDPDTGEPSGTAGTTVGNAGATSKGSSGGSLPTHPLAECAPGFDRASNPARACQWLLTKSNQCFDTFDAACACACPTSGNSVCSSSIPGGPNSATPVFCDAT